MCLSIIIPVHNYAGLIGETIASLRAQAHVDWECLIVDDGSTDGTAEYAEEAARGDARFAVHRQANCGPSAARNVGAGLARRSWLLFLDADDLLQPRATEALACAAGGTAELLVLGYAFFRDDRPLALRYHMLPTELGEDRGNNVRRFVRDNPLPICAVAIRRDLFHRLGGFDAQVRHCEDYDLWMRAALAGARFARACSLQQAAACIRLHPRSASTDRLSMLLQERTLRTQWASAMCGDAQLRDAAADNARRLFYRSGRITASHLLRRAWVQAGVEWNRLGRRYGRAGACLSVLRGLAGIALHRDRRAG